MTYAVLWKDSSGLVFAGRLELRDDFVQLAGRSCVSESRRQLRYGELTDVRVDRRLDSRLAGRPTLVLSRADDIVRIVSLDGALHELVERLSQARRRAAA